MNKVVDCFSLKEGKWTEYYSNGNIKSECNYKDGFVDGKCTNYLRNENGEIESEYYYKEGTLIKE